MKGITEKAVVTKWATTGEKVSSNMPKMYRFRLSCTYAKYHTGLFSPFIHSVVFNDSFRGQWRPWSDCMDLQADLGLHCPHIPKDTFSHDTAQIRISKTTTCLKPWTVWNEWSLQGICQQIAIFFLFPVIQSVHNEVFNNIITKTRLFKYIENFTSKNRKFSGKKLIFFIFLLKI